LKNQIYLKGTLPTPHSALYPKFGLHPALAGQKAGVSVNVAPDNSRSIFSVCRDFRMKKPIFAALGLCLWFSIAVAIQAQDGNAGPAIVESVLVSVHSGRALWQAAEKIGIQFGIPISYEDGAWEYSGDLMKSGDMPAPARFSRPDFIFPAFGDLEFRFQVDSQTQSPIDPAEKVLEDLLMAYKLQKNPGEFRIIQIGDGYSIVPNRIADHSGSLVAHRSPLDLKISLPEEERTVATAINVVLDRIREQTGQNIVIGGDGLGILGGGVGPVLEPGKPQPPRFMVRVGATNETARDVIYRTLKEMHVSEFYPKMEIPRAFWSLIYDPQSKVYVLNIQAVQHAVARPSTGPGFRIDGH
jgi:hypothetical protein